MNVNSKFDIGDPVYFLHNNTLYYRNIGSIVFTVFPGKECPMVHVEYVFVIQGTDVSIPQNNVALTREALINSILAQ